MVRDGNSIINRFDSNLSKPSQHSTILINHVYTLVRDSNSIINRFDSN